MWQGEDPVYLWLPCVAHHGVLSRAWDAITPEADLTATDAVANLQASHFTVFSCQTTIHHPSQSSSNVVHACNHSGRLINGVSRLEGHVAHVCRSYAARLACRSPQM